MWSWSHEFTGQLGLRYTDQAPVLLTWTKQHCHTWLFPRAQVRASHDGIRTRLGQHTATKSQQSNFLLTGMQPLPQYPLLRGFLSHNHSYFSVRGHANILGNQSWPAQPLSGTWGMIRLRSRRLHSEVRTVWAPLACLDLWPQHLVRQTLSKNNFLRVYVLLSPLLSRQTSALQFVSVCLLLPLEELAGPTIPEHRDLLSWSPGLCLNSNPQWD